MGSTITLAAAAIVIFLAGFVINKDKSGIFFAALLMSGLILTIITGAWSFDTADSQRDIQRAARAQNIEADADSWHIGSPFSTAPCRVELTFDDGQLFIKSPHKLATPERLEALCKK